MKVGVLGCGTVSHQYFAGLRRYPHLDLVACADLDDEAARRAAADFDIPRALTPDELLQSDAELVVNLTPPTVHHLENRRALEAGKHVYSEKPLAATFAQGAELVALAESRGLGLGCAPDTFLGPAIQAVRRELDAGTIGPVVAGVAFVSEHGYEHEHPNVDFFYKPGAGPLLDLGPYYLTALVNWLGPVEAVVGANKSHFPERTIGIGPRLGEKVKVEVPTHATGALTFANGAIVTLIASWDIWSTHLPFLELYGELGSIAAPNPDFFTGPVRVRVADEEDLAEPTAEVPNLPWDEVATGFDEGACRGIGIADLVDAIGNERTPRASGRLALHVLEVLETLGGSYSDGARRTIQTSVERPEALPPDHGPAAFSSKPQA